jgi:hypothetical protein
MLSLLYIIGVMWLLQRCAIYWEQRAEWRADIAIDPNSPFGMLKAVIEDFAIAITTSMTPAFMALNKVASDAADAFACFTTAYTDSMEIKDD